jgi:hypothetical protein
MPILDVPPDLNEPDEVINILSEYGRLDLVQIRDHCATYVRHQYRAAQDSAQLYQCLMHTLTREAHAKITLYRNDYHIGDIGCGVPLLKVIICEAHVDTNATLRLIRKQLASLNTYMSNVGSDIQQFNDHVILLQQELTARGATTNDLLTNLFKAYKEVSDKDFVQYINKKEEEYDDGTDITVEHLMRLALNKYRIRTSDNVWNAPTKEEEKIIALEAKIEQMTKAKEKSAQGKTNSNTKRRGKRDKEKGGNNSRKAYVKPAWMLIAPKSGESGKKTVDGKEYWWCTKHKAWCRHSTNECKGQNIKHPNAQANEGANADSNDRNANDPRVQLSQALANLAETEPNDE